MHDDKSLPPRLKESMFRRYEIIIAAAVKNFPSITHVDRGNMSAATVSARLRDAMLSLYRFNWPTTVVDTSKFILNYDNIIVSHRQDGILVGSKEALESAEGLTTIQPLQVVEQATPEIVVSFSDAKLLCFLAGVGAFARPIAILGISDEDANYCEENFDVRIDKKENGVYHIS